MDRSKRICKYNPCSQSLSSGICEYTIKILAFSICCFKFSQTFQISIFLFVHPLDKRVLDASLHTIAANAGTSTIYVRFKDKEGLFAAIVEPVAEEFLPRCLNRQETFPSFDSEVQRQEVGKYSSDAMLDIIDYFYEHFDVGKEWQTKVPKISSFLCTKTSPCVIIICTFGADEPDRIFVRIFYLA